MPFLDFPARKRFYVLAFRQEEWKQALADSGTQWHACLTIVGNRKLKIILLYYNALGRVPSRAKVGSGQGRMRRAEAGHHHHIAGPYLLRYAQEASWREDHRRISNGGQVDMVSGLAMKRGPSVDFSGYWQRNIRGA
jgi:hypothetical protein